MKGDDLSTLVENVHTIEVNLCLSKTENEESFRKAEAKFLEEQKMLEEKIKTESGIIATNTEAHSRMITDISENVKAFIRKFKHGYGNYDHRVEEISKEQRISNLIEQMKHQIE